MSTIPSFINTLQSSITIASPPGTVVAFAGTTAPDGWLLCNGSAISRTTYASLFNAIGVSHGSGDGSTTFRLPDYRGRFLRGVDGGANNDSDRSSRTASNTGGNTGDNVGSLQGDAIRNITGNTTGGRSLTLPANQGAFATSLNNSAGPNNGGAGEINISFDASRVVPTASDNRPKNINVNYIIKI